MSEIMSKMTSKEQKYNFLTKYQTFDPFSPKYQTKYQTDQSTKWLSKVPNFWDLVPKIPNLTSLTLYRLTPAALPPFY